MAEKDIEGDGIKWEVTGGGGSEYIRTCSRENEKEEQVSACSIGLALLLSGPNCVSFRVQICSGKTILSNKTWIFTFIFGIKSK